MSVSGLVVALSFPLLWANSEKNSYSTDKIEDPEQPTDEDHDTPTGFCQKEYKTQPQVNENE